MGAHRVTFPDFAAFNYPDKIQSYLYYFNKNSKYPAILSANPWGQVGLFTLKYLSSD